MKKILWFLIDYLQKELEELLSGEQRINITKQLKYS